MPAGAAVPEKRPASPSDPLSPLLAVRLLRLAGTVIVTAVIVSLALLLTVRFLVFPSLDEYRDEIAAKISNELGQPVAIDSISGGWDGWNPRLTISGFAIRDRAQPAGPPVLLLPEVNMLIAWTSALALDVRLKELSIERPAARDPPRCAGTDARRRHRDRSGGAAAATTAASPIGCCASARSSCAMRSCRGPTSCTARRSSCSTT